MVFDRNRLCASTVSIAVRSSSDADCFNTYPFAPARNASLTEMASVNIVTRIIFTLGRSFFSSLVAAKPLIPGMQASSRITSGRCSIARLTMSPECCTVLTIVKCGFSSSVRLSRTRGWSSTSITRVICLSRGIVVSVQVSVIKTVQHGYDTDAHTRVVSLPQELTRVHLRAPSYIVPGKRVYPGTHTWNPAQGTHL